MNGPVMYVGLWDGRRDGPQLFSAVCDRLERMGTILGRGPNSALAFNHPALPPGSGPANVEILAPNRREGGGLVQIAFSISEIDGDDEYDWSPFENEVDSMVQEIGPLLLTISTEWTASELPDPPWSHAYFLFTSGWVNLETCTDSQRVAFLALRDGSLASPMGKGLRWPAKNRNTSRDPISRDDLTAKVYHAWTGRTAPPPKASSLPELATEDLAPRELWFWSHTTPAESLLGRVELAIGPRGLTSHTWDFGQDERWRYVVSLYEPQGRSLELFLDDLRSTLPAIRPSWAGLQPQGGFLMPGPETDAPVISMITHPWVSRDWIGDELPNLEEAMAGCHREEVADGVLWITSPDLAPDSRFSEDWYDSDARFQRMTSAAEILGRAARRSLGMTP